MADTGSTVHITVDAGIHEGRLAHNWTYIGYDEINYSYVPEGQALLAKFGELSDRPYFIRAHHLFCTGNCHASYKWGSTNAYLEDDDGSVRYDWTFVDLIFDAILANGCKPFVELGFMPEQLADMSPYRERHESWMGPLYRSVGWACPPRDYQRWHDLVYELVRHCVERYGAGEAASWYWELWNEPDIFYWRGTPEQFYTLYDHTAAAVKAALPQARVGGPGTTNPAPNSHAAQYLNGFLEHCANGINAVTGEIGAPLDFVTFHVKGGGYRADPLHHPQQPPSVQRIMRDVANGYAIISTYPQFAGLECVLSEIDPDGWAAGGAWDNANLNFRNTEYYATFVAAAFDAVSEFARQHSWDVRLLSWAFMFVGERCFEGTRTFSTQGVDKAILNLFRMYAALGVERLRLISSGAHDPRAFEDAWNSGGSATIDGFATRRDDGRLAILIWSHHDDWHRSGATSIRLTVDNLALPAQDAHVEHYRIDSVHSNAYAEWVRLKRPMYPDAEQYAQLKRRDGLERYSGDTALSAHERSLSIQFELPIRGISLLTLGS